MNQYWVIYKNREDIIEGEIYDAEFFLRTNKIDGHIKIEYGIYYGLLTRIKPDNNDRTIKWIEIDPKHISSNYDFDETIKIIYFVLWFILLIKMTLTTTVYNSSIATLDF